jgi:DNA-binding beta-propeller fold protein YncE
MRAWLMVGGATNAVFELTVDPCMVGVFMLTIRSYVAFICWSLCLAALSGLPAAAQAPNFEDVMHFAPPSGVAELIYAAPYKRLIARNSGSAVAVIDATTGSSTTHASNFSFTDMSLSPDGRYVYVADYGGENIGYGTPARQHYVHRLDLEDGSWSSKQAVLAGRVEAVTSDTFVLMSIDQWVTFTYNQWGSSATITQLSTNQNSSVPGF